MVALRLFRCPFALVLRACIVTALEAFVSFKTMRNFRQVTDKTFVPPWHLEVEVHGRTFAPGADTFAKVGLPGGGNTVFFPAAPVPGARCQTLA